VDRAFRLEGGLTGLRAFNVTIGGEIAIGPIQEAGGAASDVSFRNALFLADEVPTLAEGPSNMAVDASVFVDAAGHDYHLLMGSVPVDAGEVIPEVDVDRDGVPRPFGDSYDIGAFEWTDEPPPGTDESDDGGHDDDDDGSASGSGDGAEETGSADDDDAGVETGGTGGEGTAGSADAENDGCGCTSSTTPPRWSLLLMMVAVRTRRRRKHRFSRS
jgi:MYXO-CTERM domain-containing protein